MSRKDNLVIPVPRINALILSTRIPTLGFILQVHVHLHKLSDVQLYCDESKISENNKENKKPYL